LLLDDFTISNLPQISALGVSYADNSIESVPTIADWTAVLPSLDVWLNVEETEVRYVADIVPTLSWNGGLIGIRLIFEPKDPEKLYSAYLEAYKAAQEHSKKIRLWPNDLCDFLHQKIGSFFTMNAYILEETKLIEPDTDNTAHPQTTQYCNAPLDFDPFKSLIRIDTIAAQRGLEDSENDSNSTPTESSLLSSQLKDYYDRQLDPEHRPTQSDIKAISELQGAKEVFDQQISKRFEKAMQELSTFGYPGKNNPKIIIESKAQTSEILSHNTVVRYPLFSDGINDYKLPEKYNGLGYQNLISMSFRLMSF
jgi:predicted ATP-dependent endonuclease of OLD family